MSKKDSLEWRVSALESAMRTHREVHETRGYTNIDEVVRNTHDRISALEKQAQSVDRWQHLLELNLDTRVEALEDKAHEHHDYEIDTGNLLTRIRVLEKHAHTHCGSSGQPIDTHEPDTAVEENKSGEEQLEEFRKNLLLYGVASRKVEPDTAGDEDIHITSAPTPQCEDTDGHVHLDWSADGRTLHVTCQCGHEQTIPFEVLDRDKVQKARAKLTYWIDTAAPLVFDDLCEVRDLLRAALGKGGEDE
jgi:hypothetical protein